jgi:hypothetical protein
MDFLPNMRWQPLGRIFEPQPNSWMKSHAMVPTVMHVGGSTFRVYYSARDHENRSVMGWFEADADAGWQITRQCANPALLPGDDGCFDDSGAQAHWLLEVGNELWLYYVGWNLGGRMPFYNNIGLAASTDGGLSFQRKTRGPIIPRDDPDPIFLTTPSVLHEDGVFKMWYSSCLEWKPAAEGPQHQYTVHYAESRDGWTWQKHGPPVLPLLSPDEYALARPYVVRTTNGYGMWFCSRGPYYKIQYAESRDGISWARREYGGLDRGGDGDWSAAMTAYPCVFEHGGKLFMLYNGNDYGRTGIGIAVAQ